MFFKYPVQEIVGDMNLIQLTCAGNDNCTRSENAHGDSLALAFSVASTLSLTEFLATADSCAFIVGIIEELGVHALIDGFFKHAEEVVFINQDLVESILINKFVECIVCINELNGEALNNRRIFKG